MMPACKWRGGELPGYPGRYRCASPEIIADAGVSLATCGKCFARDRDPRPGAVRGPCPHLGEPTGETLPCPCPHAPRVEVYRCGARGVCTVARPVLSVPCCLGCEVRP